MNNLEYEHYLSSYVNVFGEQLPENTKRHAIMTQNGLWRHSLVTCARASQVANREFPQFFIHPANQALHVRYVISVQRRHI